MIKINFSCSECDADFKIQHDMESRVYTPRFCVFCAEEIVTDDDDLSFEIEEDEDERFGED